MQSVAFVNRKGGVGKSSCVMHLGIEMARRGIRTLLVDCDPQSSLTQGLLGRDAITIDPARTLAALFDRPGTPMASLVLDVGRAGLGLVSGHEAMSDHNHPNPWTLGPDQTIVRDALAEVDGDWDLALLDCPPSVQAAAWAALAAADGVVVPVQLEDFAVQGLSAILDSLDRSRAVINPGLRLLGILGTMVTRCKIHDDYGADARVAFGDDVFDSSVPLAVDFKMAVTSRKGITEFKPRSAAAKSLGLVADELLARLAARVGPLEPSRGLPERMVAR